MDFFIYFIIVVAIVLIILYEIRYYKLKPDDAINQMSVYVPFYQAKALGGKWYMPITHMVKRSDGYVSFPDASDRKYILNDVRFTPAYKIDGKVQGRVCSTAIILLLFGWLFAILNLARKRKYKQKKEELKTFMFIELINSDNESAWIKLSGVKTKDFNMVEMYFK